VKEVGYELNGYEGDGVSKGRLLHEQMHAKEIGFLIDGKLTFVHWWLLDIEVWETARFFSRGSSWRMWLAGEKVKELSRICKHLGVMLMLSLVAILVAGKGLWLTLGGL